VASDPSVTVIEIRGRRLELLQSDITAQRLDAIANAANAALAGNRPNSGTVSVTRPHDRRTVRILTG
jgi:hypothetical protein